MYITHYTWAVVGEGARLLGGAAGGVITNDHLGYEGCEVGVAVLSSDRITADLFVEPDLVGREYEAGRRLGGQIQGSDASSLLFFYDAVKQTLRNGGPELNMATPVIEGLKESLSGWPAVAGAGLTADAQFVSPAYQIIDDIKFGVTAHDLRKSRSAETEHAAVPDASG